MSNGKKTPLQNRVSLGDITKWNKIEILYIFRTSSPFSRLQINTYTKWIGWNGLADRNMSNILQPILLHSVKPPSDILLCSKFSFFSEAKLETITVYTFRTVLRFSKHLIYFGQLVHSQDYRLILAFTVKLFDSGVSSRWYMFLLIRGTSKVSITKLKL